MSSSPEASTKVVTFRDVVIAALPTKYAQRQLRAFDPQPSKHTMLRALIHLEKGGHKRQAQILARHIEWVYPSAKGKPSRVKPRIGDVRKYSVQWQKSGLFARIPVDILGVKKGEDVVAEFKPEIMPGVIIVRLMTPDEKSKGKAQKLAEKVLEEE